MYLGKDHVLDIMQFGLECGHDGMVLFVAEYDSLPVADDGQANFDQDHLTL